MTEQDKLTADEKRRRAITDWWERQTLREFIARIRARAHPNDRD